jgi:hypothetical protein
MIAALGSAYLAVFAAATPLAVPQGRGQRLADWALNRMQELNIQQLEALYSLLDDDGNGKLTVHEMIDLFDGINNDALLIDDCDGNPNPHHCEPQSHSYALRILNLQHQTRCDPPRRAW